MGECLSWNQKKKFMKLITTMCVIVTCLIAIRVRAQPAFITDSLDTYITREMQRWNIPGVAIAIVKDGKVIAMKEYGVRDLDSKQGVDENTLFRIGSCTKAFTATCVTLLDYQKKLSLEDHVTKWIPDFRMYDTCTTTDVRIRDILCHRLGLETFEGDFVNWNSTMTRMEIIHNLRNLKPVYPFRTTWGYCNAGFVTAGQIIQNVTGKTYEEFVKDNILDPLQMTRSSTSYNAIKTDNNAASAYTLVNNAISKIDYDNTDNMTPAASINSCAHDMANWLMMQLGNGMFNGTQVIPKEVLDETHTSQDVISDRYSQLFPAQHFSNYCLGWEAMDYAGKKVVSHDGGVYGFVTNVTLIPEENIGWVILTNTDVNNLYVSLQYQFLDAFMNLPYKNYSSIFYNFSKKGNDQQQKEIDEWKKTVAKKNPPPMDLKYFCGKYHNAAYGDVEVKLEKKQLVIHFQHHNMTAILEYMDDTNFLCTYSDPEFAIKEVPFLLEEGKVKQMTLTCNDFIDFMTYDFMKVQ